MTDNNSTTEWEEFEYTREDRYEGSPPTQYYAWTIDENNGDVDDVRTHKNFPALEDVDIEERREQLRQKMADVSSDEAIAGFQWQIEVGIVSENKQYDVLAIQTTRQGCDLNAAEYLDQEFATEMRALRALNNDENDIRVLQTRLEGFGPT